MDEKDSKIIALLKENSRYSIREIAEKLSMRPSTVHVRINKLIDKGIIEQFTIRLNDKAMGENFTAFMMLKGSVDIHAPVLQQSCVKEVFRITGEYNVMMKVKFSGVEEFDAFTQDFRNSYPHVQTTLTMVATQKLKEDRS